jgi:Rrf2 family protein
VEVTRVSGLGSVGQNGDVQIPAKVDYAIRALLSLAASDSSLTTEQLAAEQHLPSKFLGAILSDLRRGGVVSSQRGADGGFRLARPASDITIAEVLRVLGGPIAGVRGLLPESLEYEGAATHLRDVWIALRGSLRQVLEHVTLADIVSGQLPVDVTRFTDDPDAWHVRP